MALYFYQIVYKPVKFLMNNSFEEPIRAEFQLKTVHHPMGFHQTLVSAERHFETGRHLVSVRKQRGGNVVMLVGVL